MSSPRPSASSFLLAAGCLASFAFGSVGLNAAPDGDGPDRKPAGEAQGRPGPDDSRDGRDDPFRNLSSEERSQLREAVRRAWSDPAVIEARDKLKSAAEAYQNALNGAIRRNSPELSETLESLRQETDSAFRMYGHGPGKGGSGEPGGPGGRRGDWRDYEGFLTMENPPFLRDLSGEQQELYRSVHARAMESDDVRSRLESLRALKESDDEIRKQRIEQIRRVHQAIRKAMVEADPRVKDFLPETGGRPPGGSDRPDAGPGPGPERPLPPPPPAGPPARE